MTAAAGPKVVVIGAGVVGAAVAARVAQGDARVTVLDEGAPERRATLASLAWINSNSAWAPRYHALRMRSLALWRRQLEASPGFSARLNGGLCWGATPEECSMRMPGART